MRRYQILPHTADTRLQVTADSTTELFRGALEGLSEIIKHDVTKHPSDTATVTQIEISSPDITALLIDFLNEILTKDVIEKVIFFDIVQIELSDTHVVASVRGTATDTFDEDIKAVTYHGADAQKHVDGNYQVEVVFDV